MTDREVHKLTLSELENYFQKQPLHSQSVLPISPLRIQSYLNNPRANSDDTVLYFIKSNEKIIAFRTVWADHIYIDGEAVKFAWCSGNWVSHEYRRKGLSMMLLKEVMADWNEKLMFTNYAPESLAGYLKSGLFKLQCKRDGVRFYFNANINELYSNRRQRFHLNILVNMLALVFKLLYHLRRLFYKYQGLGKYTIEESNEFSACYSFVNQSSLFNRTAKELKWIFNFPWLEIGDGSQRNYPFSWKTKQFEYRFVKINGTDELCSFVILNRNGVVKLLYWHATDGYLNLIAKWLVNYCHREKVKTLTVVDRDMADLIKKIRNLFVWSKPFSVNIYSTFNVPPTHLKVFDGDGDYIFT